MNLLPVHQLDNFQALIDQLEAAGISANVVINFPFDRSDPQALKSLLDGIKAAGGTPEVTIRVDLNSVHQDKLPTPKQPAPVEEGLEVVVSDDKLNCMTFSKVDKAGKPIMEIREPRIHLMKGTRFRVSTTHKAGEKDTGNGTVFATGNVKHYLIVACPSNPAAEGLYVRQAEVTVV